MDGLSSAEAPITLPPHCSCCPATPITTLLSCHPAILLVPRQYAQRLRKQFRIHVSHPATTPPPLHSFEELHSM